MWVLIQLQVKCIPITVGTFWWIWAKSIKNTITLHVMWMNTLWEVRKQRKRNKVRSNSH